MIKVPLRRYGGKVNLAKWIVSHFPVHQTYIEPFCGSASVFFAKQPAQAEFLNDKDARVKHAFEMIRARPFELAAAIWATPYMQSNWRNTASKDDIEKAALFIASTQQFYAGATHNSTWSVDSGHANKNKAQVWADWFQRILPAAARLKYAQILDDDAIAVIDRFSDLEYALFYVDPPYRGHESEYGQKVDYPALVAALTHVRGKVVVSEVEENRHLYPHSWHVATRTHTGRARTGAHKMQSKKYQECLFMNYAPNTDYDLGF